MRRMRIGRTGGLLGVTATLLTSTAHGQDATAIEEMARRLADIEKQNETLKTRVNELEAADADVWLTQERSDQIRGVVTDVLDSRLVLRQTQRQPARRPRGLAARRLQTCGPRSGAERAHVGPRSFTPLRSVLSTPHIAAAPLIMLLACGQAGELYLIVYTVATRVFWNI